MAVVSSWVCWARGDTTWYSSTREAASWGVEESRRKFTKVAGTYCTMAILDYHTLILILI